MVAVVSRFMIRKFHGKYMGLLHQQDRMDETMAELQARRSLPPDSAHPGTHPDTQICVDQIIRYLLVTEPF